MITSTHAAEFFHCLQAAAVELLGKDGAEAVERRASELAKQTASR